jgi:hypothetical protein
MASRPLRFHEVNCRALLGTVCYLKTRVRKPLNTH